MVSVCCHAPVQVVQSDEAAYYVCVDCLMVCDPIAEPQVEDAQNES